MQTTTAPLDTEHMEPTGYIAPVPPKRSRPPLPVGARLLLVSVVLFISWMAADFAYVTLGAELDHAQPADVIIVLGCQPYNGSGGPSDCITARATHAAELYKEGLAPNVLASGGQTDMGGTESTVIVSVLAREGVPADHTFQESRSKDTIQNMENSAQIMKSKGWHTAILVTEPYHINRASLIARDTGITAYSSPAVDSPIWQNTELRLWKLGRDTLSLVLYQLKGLVGVHE